jgi:hypothetical protein
MRYSVKVFPGVRVYGGHSRKPTSMPAALGGFLAARMRSSCTDGTIACVSMTSLAARPGTEVEPM